MPSPVRYILHPGWIRVKDNLRYITADELISLYKLRPLFRDPNVHYIVDPDGKGSGICETAGDVHLYPRADGNYSLPVVGRLKGEELKQELIERLGAMSPRIRLLVLLVAVAGLFRPGIVYTSFLTGIAQEITSDQQGAEAMTWLMQELARLESDKASK